MRIVAFITDFGTRDYYVGAMKGVVLGLAPNVRIVDITHDVEPQNILHGAFVLRHVFPWFPLGTIFVTVVDPGVGSGRRIILGSFGGRFVIAPNNGLVTFVKEEFPIDSAYFVENVSLFPPGVSRTFHGRDIMAPAAAHLANGVAPESFGPQADRFETVKVAARAKHTADGLEGRVLHVDRFGTLVTNIHAEQLPELATNRSDLAVTVNGTIVGPICDTFSDVQPGAPIAFMGSCGLLEIAINGGRAADRFGPAKEVRVTIG